MTSCKTLLNHILQFTPAVPNLLRSRTPISTRRSVTPSFKDCSTQKMHSSDMGRCAVKYCIIVIKVCHADRLSCAIWDYSSVKC